MNGTATTKELSESQLYKYPRRSCEALALQTLECEFISPNPFKEIQSLLELQEYMAPYIWEERVSQEKGLTLDSTDKIRDKFENHNT